MKIFLNVWVAVIFLGLSTAGASAQEVVLPTGGESQGAGGSSSYSIGQIAIETNSGDSIMMAEGVQQPFEISEITGLEKTEGIKLVCHLYPNPAKTLVMLEIDDYSLVNLTYTLLDIQGNLLELKQINGSNTVIDMKHLAPAIYILQVSDQDNIIKSFKIIKN